MKKFIYKLYRKFISGGKGKNTVYVSIGTNSNCNGLHVDVRNGRKGEIYVEIGEDSIVSGTYIIEKPSGYIKIGKRTFIGGGLFISIDRIEIGDDVMFSWGCTVMDNNAHSLRWEERKNDVREWKKGVDEGRMGFYKNWDYVKSGKIVIKNKAWIGFDCIILKGVTIGEGAVVGAGSVVTQDVPDFTIVAGNPATIIRHTE